MTDKLVVQNSGFNINSSFTGYNVALPRGMVAFYYSDGQQYNIVNYAQIAPIQGGVSNSLVWSEVGIGVNPDQGGLFVPIAVSPTQFFAPIAGGTVSVSSSTYINTVVIKPAGTLATLTLDINNGNVDGQIVFITFTQIITALTVGANFGTLGLAQPTAATAGQTFAFSWSVSDAKWERFQ